MIRSLLGASFLVLATAAAPAPAQDGLRPRPPIIKPESARVEARVHLTHVVSVKFRDGLLVRRRDGALSDEGTGALDGTRPLLDRRLRGEWQRLHAVDEARLAAMHATAERTLGRAVADPNLSFLYVLADGEDAADVLDRLNELAVVELAAPMPRPAPAPTPPDYEPQQGYLDPPFRGIDAECLWRLPAGAGSGVRIADVEYSWNLGHDDLPTITLLGDDPTDPFGDTNHGTAVLGQLGALDNGWGVHGIADESPLLVAAVNTGGVQNIARAILVAAAALDAGDVLLIEQQVFGPNYTGEPAGTQFGLVPAEWNLDVYNAIVTAVGNGIVVVEAGGNGSQDLDAPEYAMDNDGHYPFLPENDSGAIIVGAGAAPEGSDVARSRLGFSNYGSTVDLQGWGEAIHTTGYGDAYSSEGADRLYTDEFGGTSGASPIVAGACALVQAAYKADTGTVLPPFDLLLLLEVTGQPQEAGTHPVSERIGPLPDAAGAIASLLPSFDLDGNGVPDDCANCPGRILAAATVSPENLGEASDIDGSLLVLASPYDDGEGVPDVGSATVFRFDGNAYWIEEAELRASDGTASDRLGEQSVAVDGSTVLLGAWAGDSDCGGTPCATGAAYVFRHVGGAWVEERKLVATDAENDDRFGRAVAVSGDRALVGASEEDEGGFAAGAAYLFERNAGGADQWGQVRKLRASDSAANAWFGRSVAIDGDVAIVGASLDDGADADAGSAYVFARDAGGAGQWGEVRRLRASDPSNGAQFGAAVAVSGDTIVVGAILAVNGGLPSGAVYVFERDAGGPGQWGQVARLQAPSPHTFQAFGFKVALSGDVVVVGAPGDDSAGQNTGAAFLFRRDAGGPDQWGLVTTLRSPEPEAQDHFGWSVGHDGGTTIVGAKWDDAQGFNSGAGYLYDGEWDCNANGTLDRCEFGLPTSDCNGNAVPDACDIAYGTSPDADGNGVPDECQCPGDFDLDGEIGLAELLVLLAQWGDCDDDCPADLDDDGSVGISDLLIMLATWGPCP